MITKTFLRKYLIKHYATRKFYTIYSRGYENMRKFRENMSILGFNKWLIGLSIFEVIGWWWKTQVDNFNNGFCYFFWRNVAIWGRRTYTVISFMWSLYVECIEWAVWTWE